MADKIPFIETRDEKLAGDICGGENDDKTKAARRKTIQKRATDEEKKKGIIDLQVPGGCVVGDDGVKHRDYGDAKGRDFKTVRVPNTDGPGETEHLVDKKTGESKRQIPISDGLEEGEPALTQAPEKEKPKSTLERLGDALKSAWPFGEE